MQPQLDSNGQIANIDTSTLNPGSSNISGTNLDLQTVINSLNNEVGNISSSSTSIDNAVNQAIQSQRDAATANQQRLESQYGRESGYLAEKLGNERTSMLEQSRGGAVSGSALMLIDKEIDKSLKDLDMRKNELILQGNAAAAEKISELQMQQLTMKMDMQQKHFNNLLGLGQFQSDIMQEQSRIKESSRNFTLQELEYNLNVRQQKANEAKNISDQANETARLNIMRSELILKQAAEKRIKDLDKMAGAEGWVNADMQLKVVNALNPLVTSIANNTALSDSEKQSQLATLYLKQRRMYSPDIVTDDALAEVVLGIRPSTFMDRAHQEFAPTRESIQQDILSGTLNGTQGTNLPGITAASTPRTIR